MKASCLCGGVEFSIDGEFEYAGYCHCSECQKFSGSANSAFGGLNKNKYSKLSCSGILNGTNHDILKAFNNGSWVIFIARWPHL